jgi:hypothetical protein
VHKIRMVRTDDGYGAYAVDVDPYKLSLSNGNRRPRRMSKRGRPPIRVVGGLSLPLK